MKILAINGGPHIRGITMSLVDPFLEGARKAGAETELIHIKKFKINPCLGCHNCWLVTPGQCSQNDDMQMLYQKLRDADIWVLASPLYIGGVSGPMKMFLDRVIPLVQPIIETRSGRSRHPLQNGTKQGGIILISNCGLWEMENFNPMLSHVKEICEHTGRNFAGALLRPHGPALPERAKSAIFSVHDIFAAAKDAGRQAALTGNISAKTSAIVSRKLMPRFLYNIIVNRRFNDVLEKIKK